MIGDCELNRDDNSYSTAADRLDNGDAAAKAVEQQPRHMIDSDRVLNYGDRRAAAVVVVAVEVLPDKCFVMYLDGAPDSSNHLI